MITSTIRSDWAMAIRRGSPPHFSPIRIIAVIAPGAEENQALIESKPQRRYQAAATAVEAATPSSSSAAESGQSSTRWASCGVT